MGRRVGLRRPLAMVRFVVRSFVLLLACLAGCAAPLQHPFPLNPPARPAAVAPAAWGSTLLFTDGRTGHCSAVAVGPAIATTARHCLHGWNGEGPAFSGGFVLHPDGSAAVVLRVAEATDEDAAVLYLAPGLRNHAPLGAVEPSMAGHVLGYGCDGGLRLRARSVTFVRRIRTPDPSNVYFDEWRGVACKGDSGGGVFDARGALVGITVGITASEGLLYTVPAELLAPAVGEL